jgi:acyl-CoA synthetase (AMP-forming)/AMP-acid ligase II
LIRWRAQRHPNLDAIWYEGKTTTYGELDRSSSELAGGLAHQLGLQPGDRVAILDKNCPEYLELVFALDKAGVVAAPLNWRLTPREVKAIVDDIKPALLVAGEEFKDHGLAFGIRTMTYA